MSRSMIGFSFVHGLRSSQGNVACLRAYQVQEARMSAYYSTSFLPPSSCINDGKWLPRQRNGSQTQYQITQSFAVSPSLPLASETVPKFNNKIVVPSAFLGDSSYAKPALAKVRCELSIQKRTVKLQYGQNRARKKWKVITAASFDNNEDPCNPGVVSVVVWQPAFSPTGQYASNAALSFRNTSGVALSDTVAELVHTNVLSCRTPAFPVKELAFLSKALKRFVGAMTLHFQTARNEWQMLVDVPILMCKNKEPGHGSLSSCATNSQGHCWTNMLFVSQTIIQLPRSTQRSHCHESC